MSTSCVKCGGTGWYAYDATHSKPCEACCEHGKGWFLLLDHYGADNGRYACKAGCGTVRDVEPEEIW